MGHHKPAHWGLLGSLHRAIWPRSFEICRHHSFWAVPDAALPRRVGNPAVAFPYQLNSPTDALIDLKVRGRLGPSIPAWGGLNARAGLCIGAIPQRRPAYRCDARRLCLHPDVVQYLVDVGAVRDEHDDSHLPAGRSTQQNSPRIAPWAVFYSFNEPILRPSRPWPPRRIPPTGQS